MAPKLAETIIAYTKRNTVLSGANDGVTLGLLGWDTELNKPAIYYGSYNSAEPKFLPAITFLPSGETPNDLISDEWEEVEAYVDFSIWCASREPNDVTNIEQQLQGMFHRKEVAMVSAPAPAYSRARYARKVSAPVQSRWDPTLRLFFGLFRYCFIVATG